MHKIYQWLMSFDPGIGIKYSFILYTFSFLFISFPTYQPVYACFSVSQKENQKKSLLVDSVDFSMAGFATLTGGTTGGEGGLIDTVSTGYEIAAAIDKKQDGDINQALILCVDSTITQENSPDSKINIKDVSDISIIGIGKKAEFDGIGIKIWKAENVIIRNLLIHHVSKGEGDCISIEGPASHIWIDHCELFNEYEGVDKDFYDGLLDVKRESEYITISWNVFHDSWKASLVGSSDGDEYNRKITYHHNYFYHCNSRLPSFRYGHGHLYNNYYNQTASSTINSRMGACLRVENNYFKAANDPIVYLYSDEPGYWDVSNNVFDNCAGSQPEESNCSFAPPYDYTMDPVNEVPDLVMQYAGTGIITISDTSSQQDTSQTDNLNEQLIIKKNDQPHLFHIYPVPFGNQAILHVRLKRESQLNISFYNMQGQMVLKKHLLRYPEGIHQIHVETKELIAGIYIFKLVIDDTFYRQRVIVK